MFSVILFSHPKVPLVHVFPYVLSPSKPLNSKQTTFCSHIVDDCWCLGTKKKKQNSYQFSWAIDNFPSFCRYSQRFSEASAWAVYHLGEWDDVYQHRPPWVENKTNGVATSSENGKGSPPRKDLLAFPPILRSIHGANLSKFGRHQTRQLSFFWTFGWQCRILRHPHRLEDTQFNKVSKLHKNHIKITKIQQKS